MRISRTDALIAAALGFVLMCTYLLTQAAIAGPFVFDDFPNLGNLERLAGGLTPRSLADYLQAFPGDPGRPLAALSFLVDDQAWPTSPAPFKRTNLLIHLLNGVLVFGFVRTASLARLSEKAASAAGLLAASAWLLHPMQLSTTMLVVQRMTQLMTLATLTTVWWTAWYLRSAELSPRRSILLLAGTALGTVIAFLCKENGALLPLYVGALCLTVLRAHYQTGSRSSRWLLIGGLSAPIIAMAVWLLLSALNYKSDGLRNFTPFERLLTESTVIVDYLVRLVLPRLSGSGLFHDDYPVSRGLLDPPSTLFASMFCVALLGAAVVARKRMPLFAFAVFWYFGGHLLESTTYPLELYFEHRNYLPMVGPIGAASVWLVGRPPGRMRAVYASAFAVWLLLCAGMTAMQARVWGSGSLLANVWAEESPRSTRAIEFRVKALVDRGDYDAAIKLLHEQASTNPEMRKLALHAVLIDCYRNELTADEIRDAASDMRRIPFNRSSLEAISMLNKHAQSGRCGPALSARNWESLIDAMLANPSFAKGPAVAAFLWVEKASMYLHTGNIPNAIEALDRAYAVHKDPLLASQATVLMLNKGLCGRAEQWRRRTERAFPRGFDGFLLRYSRKRSEAQLVHDVQACYKARERQSPSATQLRDSGGQAMAAIGDAKQVMTR